MNVDHLLRRSVLSLKPYVAGMSAADAAARYDVAEVIKLGSNEHPLGPSPRVIAAMSRALADSHLYPPRNEPQLRQDLSDRFGLPPEWFVLCNGSDNCLLTIVSTFLNDDEEAIIPLPTFPMYETVVRVAGGRPAAIPPTEFPFSIKLSRVLARVTPATKLVFVCNPNNPTGSLIESDELEQFLQRLPEGVLVILDEAYAEFIDDPSYPVSADIVRKYPNVIAVRTFSKVYGLAGMRLGYIIAHPAVTSQLMRVREPFCVNAAVYAGARAALSDDEYSRLTVDLIRRSSELLCSGLDRLGLRYVPSRTNFVLVDLGRPCAGVIDALLREGIIIRPGTTWDLPDLVRISVGTERQMGCLLQALEKILRPAMS